MLAITLLSNLWCCHHGNDLCSVNWCYNQTCCKMLKNLSHKKKLLTLWSHTWPVHCRPPPPRKRSSKPRWWWWRWPQASNPYLVLAAHISNYWRPEESGYHSSSNNMCFCSATQSWNIGTQSPSRSQPLPLLTGLYLICAPNTRTAGKAHGTALFTFWNASYLPETVARNLSILCFGATICHSCPVQLPEYSVWSEWRNTKTVRMTGSISTFEQHRLQFKRNTLSACSLYQATWRHSS